MAIRLPKKDCGEVSVISKAIELEDFSRMMEIVGECGFCADRTHQEEIFKKVSRLFSATMSVCALGDAASLTHESLVVNQFPKSYLRSYFSEELHRQDPLLQEITSSNRASFFNLTQLSMEQRIISLNAKFGLTSCVSANFVGTDGKATFLCLSNPERSVSNDCLNLLRLLLPHLHYMMDRMARMEKADASQPALSFRECEVLKWVMAGKSNWDIAVIMGISENTVKFHMKNIFRKMEVSNKIHAIIKAAQLGILTL